MDSVGGGLDCASAAVAEQKTAAVTTTSVKPAPTTLTRRRAGAPSARIPLVSAPTDSPTRCSTPAYRA